MWFKKSVLETDEYQTLLKRLLDVEYRVSALEASNQVFRDKVLRKVQRIHEEPEDLNTSTGGGLLRGNHSKVRN